MCILDNSPLSYVSFANISPSFPYQLHHFTTPPPVHKGFIFSTISLTVGIFCFVVVVLTVAIPMDGLPRWLSCKESTYNAGDADSIPGSGRSPAEGNGNPLQYSCLENPMDREAWWDTVHGVTKSWDVTERLNVKNNNENTQLQKIILQTLIYYDTDKAGESSLTTLIIG